MSKWTDFEARMQVIKDLDAVLGLLSWDEETYLPSKSHEGRGQQTGTVEALRHQRLVDPQFGDLIDGLLDDASVDEAQRLCVVRAQRLRDLAVKVPESLVTELAEARSRSLHAWQVARKADDYSSFAPHLLRVFQLTSARADALADGGDRYDALLDEHEPGMKTAELVPVLDALRSGLLPRLERILSKSDAEDPLAGKRFDDAAQWTFTMNLLEDLGFDFDRGRQDRSSHPFSCSIGLDDVRVTTRIFADNLKSSIFSTVHECGHGLYEQGFDDAHARSFLAFAPSLGLHESQSRLWENIVGRSLPFWQFYYPKLSALHSDALADVDLQTFHRSVNRVERSLVRVEADEVTYNLHIMLRFDLERALLSGDLSIADLPAAWNEKMQSYLGVAPPSDADGCMQDIHWAMGIVGYFPTYTLGNLWAAQLMDAYEKVRPSVWSDIAAGEFSPLLDWLRTHVHRRGHSASAAKIVKDVCGAGLSVEPFLGYLDRKYAD